MVLVASRDFVEVSLMSGASQVHSGDRSVEMRAHQESVAVVLVEESVAGFAVSEFAMTVVDNRQGATETMEQPLPERFQMEKIVQEELCLPLAASSFDQLRFGCHSLAEIDCCCCY